jgi:hypothetical protein
MDGHGLDLLAEPDRLDEFMRCPAETFRAHGFIPPDRSPEAVEKWLRSP